MTSSFIRLILLSAAVFTAPHAKAAGFHGYVMGPLAHVNDWGRFEKKLETLRRAGVRGLTTDIWWGAVEARGDNQFDWSYYRRLLDSLKRTGMRWVPIMSFHQCGGNIGDDCDIPIPSWVKNLGDWAYVDDHGYRNTEAVSPWFEPAYRQYREFMEAFAAEFYSSREWIDKIYVGLGPAGELRFPAYNFGAGWNYPQAGRLQAYSDLALAGFRSFVRERYTKVDAVNRVWGTSLRSFEQIQPPRDGDRFFRGGWNSAYGRDFLEWYQGSLEVHLRKMAPLARGALGSLGVPVSGKLAGIHWLVGSREMPRAAERAAGYVDYRKILKAYSESQIQLTFTAMEMGRGNPDGEPAYSAPRQLVSEVLAAAREFSVPVSGENALPVTGSDWGFRNIEEVIQNERVQAFTLLRMQHVVGDNGEWKPELTWFRDHVLRFQRN